MDAASITESLLEEDARGEPLGPAGLTFLMRRYAAAGGDHVRAALERGLTQALERVASGDSPPAWIHVLCEAAAITDNERIVDAVADASQGLRRKWPCRDLLLDATRSVDACLASAILLADRGVIGQTIDELERIVSLVYRPGERLPLSLRTPDDSDGGIEEHVATASMLLAAYDLTARLPYSMLAEELVQPLRFDNETGGVPVRCSLARVLGGLARLHDDDEYVRAAVVARASDYRAEARTILESVARRVETNREDAALFGLVTDELARPS
jgi:hypothetical protein